MPASTGRIPWTPHPARAKSWGTCRRLAETEPLRVARERRSGVGPGLWCREGDPCRIVRTSVRPTSPRSRRPSTSTSDSPLNHPAARNIIEMSPAETLPLDPRATGRRKRAPAHQGHLRSASRVFAGIDLRPGDRSFTARSVGRNARGQMMECSSQEGCDELSIIASPVQSSDGQHEDDARLGTACNLGSNQVGRRLTMEIP